MSSITYKEFIDKKQELDDKASAIGIMIAAALNIPKFYLSDLIIKYYPDFIDVATNNYDYDYVTFPPNLLDASEDEINKFITELVNKEKLENEKRIAEYRLLQLKQKEMQFEELKKELGK